MKIYLLDPRTIRPDVSEHQRACFDQIRKCAEQDIRRQHLLCENPSEADLVLAGIQWDGFGPFFSFLTHSRFFQSHKHKIICYCPDDLIYPAVPGLYPAITPWWVRQGWGRGAPYLSSHIHQHRFDPLSSTVRDILFSFVGSTKTDPLRQKLSQLDHPRARFVDSTPASSKQYWFEKSEDSIRASFEQYRDLMSRTKFALCPRGVSASSIRLYEAMESGCVPIIIADDLVLPDGPDWKSFSIRIAEEEISEIPALMEALEPKFEEMSWRARAAWEEFFSPASAFHQMVELGAMIQGGLSSGKRLWLEVIARAGEYLIPRNIRIHLRHALRRFR